MPPEHTDPENPQHWLSRARGSLLVAKSQGRTPGVFYEDLCFMAQQAAEKAIKAVFVSRKLRFPKTHDLGDLLTRLQRVGIEIPDEVSETDDLTQYAVVTRYPGPAQVDEEGYREAIRLAECVLRWAESLIGKK